MSVCRSWAPTRISRGGLLGLGVALVVIGGAPSLAFADNNGETSGGTVGGAGSHGSEASKAEFSAGTVSQASEHGKHVSAATVSEGEAKSLGLSRRGVSHAKVKTYASASASKHKKALTAKAVAGVAVAAGAADRNGHVLVLSSGGSVAFAQSGKKTLSAYAASGTGASALAESHGKKVYTTSSVEGGTTSTFKQGQWNYTISYNTTGAFAIAMSNKKSVGAIAGTTTEAGALASGDLGAFLQSSTFASAYASPGMASAYAEASGFGWAGGGFGSSWAFSSSWASASVTSGDEEKAPALTVGSSGCDSNQWKHTKTINHCNIEF